MIHSWEIFILLHQLFLEADLISNLIMSNILKHQFLSSTQFYALQKKYVFSAINTIYKIYRNRLLDESKARETVEVSGDGRVQCQILHLILL